jgi:hypothetical protein
MDFNRWWEELSAERYWLEITDRTDLGVDLNAPQTGRDGKPVWHYSLLNEVRDGDIVFHYHKEAGEGAITAWSRASGRPWEDAVSWAPHAGVATEPILQEGWRLALEGFHPIQPAVSLSDIREAETLIRVVEAELAAGFDSPLYTPFEMGDRITRPKQAYLAKLPSAYLDIFPQLAVETGVAAEAFPVGVDEPLGEEYRRPDESVMVATSDPFDRDPSLVERALRSHASTQNALADFLAAAGQAPRSPKASEPNYDLAWDESDCTFVVEVKSLSAANEERQLRLALGQVLRYAFLLTLDGVDVKPVVVVSREPDDSSWIEVLDTQGVLLAWPGAFDRLIS